MQKARNSYLIFSVIYWTLTTLLYAVIRLAGYPNEDGSPILNTQLFVQVIITGLVIGIVLSLFNRINAATSKTKRTFSRTILFNALVYILFFFVVTFFSGLHGNTLDFAINFIFSTESLVAIAFMAINSIIFHFIVQVNRLIGPGVLIEYITGKYFKPVEEERIFMFLDLKSSTTIAEELGHSLYSQLIQDCFELVAAPATKFEARIYQYVGDEIVVTWKFSQTTSKENCIHFFFDFQNQLHDKKEYFLEQYGLVPAFKAGLHYGKVMATEVGKLKSEIAYHGDVLNAASRIQGMCNELGQSLLISEKLLTRLSLTESYSSSYMGNLTLKGKNEKIKVHAINHSN